MSVSAGTGAAWPGLNAKPVVQNFGDQVMVRTLYNKLDYAQPVFYIALQHFHVAYLRKPMKN